MAITKIVVTENIVAQGHPSLADIKNRAAQELHTKMLVGHDSSGAHRGISSLCFLESGTFTGDGEEDRAITLTDTELLPNFVQVLQVPEEENQELIVNGGFDSDTTGWAVRYGTIASVAGGVSGNCCQVTQDSYETVANGGFTAGWTTYTITGTGTASWAVNVAGGQAGNCGRISIANDAGEWSQVVVAQVIAGYYPGTYMLVSIYVKCTDAALTGAGATFSLHITGGAGLLNEPLPTDWTQYSVIGRCDTANQVIFDFTLYTAIVGTFTGIYLDTCSGVRGVSVAPSVDITTIPVHIYRLAFSVKAGTAAASGVVNLIGTSSFYSSGHEVSLTADWLSALTEYSTNYPYFIADLAAEPFRIHFPPQAQGVTYLLDSVSILANHGTDWLFTRQPFRLDVFRTAQALRGRRGTEISLVDDPDISAITTLATGSFTVSAGVMLDCNALDVPNFYYVLGTHPAGTYTGTPELGTDPNWVEDGQQMLGGTAGTEPGNRVEDHIDDNFLIEHTQAGAHNPDIFAGLMKIETGLFVATGGADVISLVNTTLDISELWVFKENSIVLSATDAMTQPAVKSEATAAFVTTALTALGTGSFTFTGTVGTTYYYMALGM